MVVKFLVTWLVVTSVLVPCQPSNPVCDDYGRCFESMSTLALACWDTSIKSMSKEFDTREEAEAFAAAGNGDTGDIMMPGDSVLKDFKIEEIKR